MGRDSSTSSERQHFSALFPAKPGGGSSQVENGIKGKFHPEFLVVQSETEFLIFAVSFVKSHVF